MSRVRKAIVAAAGAAVTAYVAVQSNGVTADEWGGIVAAAVAVGLATWGVPNRTDDEA